ncbi:hypothetical protein Ahy_A10g049360 isoform A [Arachis hypogaea]|uniref:Protein FAR1-RELATED SEQUENCE n=1 Tax=Arachis hypogaea TaxID=3818 RepID=A0A445B722_ARAHY|nr:hypothetical protein Ahy_A10g049360 isoform A [Arachis hypogaea]
MYTHEKFREVQAQFREKVNCITRSMHSTLGFTTYKVVEQVSNSTFNKFFVTYDAVSREVKCQYLLFESRGILCRHSLSILSFERVDNSKNIKRRQTDIKSSQDEPLLEPRSKRFDDLVFWSHNICEFASESEELNGILHRAFNKVMAEMQEYQERSKGKSSLSHEEVTLSDMNDLQSPPRVKTRGWSKNRLGSNLEKKISNATKKKKKTAPSELNLLDYGSMIQSSSSLYNAPDMNYLREDYTIFAIFFFFVPLPRILPRVFPGFSLRRHSVLLASELVVLVSFFQDPPTSGPATSSPPPFSGPPPKKQKTSPELAGFNDKDFDALGWIE